MELDGGLNILNLIQKFSGALKVLQNLVDGEKEFMHVGEVMACWTYLAFVENIIAHEEIGLNTTTNPELKDILQEGLKTAKDHEKQMMDFLKSEGVSLPSAPESKPQSDPNAIPLGAKFTDDELINTININFIIAADMCAAAASQSLRADIGLMFIKFQTDKLALGFKSKDLMKKKGWLKYPPIYQPPGSPQQ